MKYLRVKINGEEIEYFVNGKGKNIIFIHGLGSSAKVWKKVINRLSNKFRCWTISLPKYKDFEIRIYSELIKGFIEKLKIENPYVVGSSLGGLISIDFANRNEIEKMVLVSTPLTRITPKGLKILIESLDKKINEDEFFKRLSEWFLSIIPATKKIMKKNSLKFFTKYIKGIANLDFPFDCSKLKLDEEFILVYGKDDLFLKILHGLEIYEEIGAKKIIVLDSGHSIPTKNPKKLSEIIENFFSDKPKDIIEVIVEFISESLEKLFDFIANFLNYK